MNTKIAVLCIIFILSGAFLFSQAHFQFGMGLMYLAQTLTESSSDGQPLQMYYVGVTGDLLFSLSRSWELGAELGYYVGGIWLVVIAATYSEIPIDALVRLNLSPDRKVAFEFRGGLLISSIEADAIWGESDSLSDSRLHVGCRLLLDWFYIGFDYVAQSQLFNSTAAFETGVKWSF